MKRAEQDCAKTGASRIELFHLRCAIAAADYGSFRRAADALSTRHSALSRSVKRLEELLGISLFTRSSAGLSLTAEGRSVLRIARLILEQVEVLAAAGRRRIGLAREHLSVGFYTSMSSGNLRASLLEFKRRFPETELATVERSRSRLLHSLKTGTLDLVFMTGAASISEDGAIPLWSERILLSLPKGHRLTNEESIFWTDLRGEKLLLSQYDPGSEFEDLLISKLVSPTDRPLVEWHDVSRGIVKSLVSMGFGISLVTESDIGASFAGLVYREVRDGTGPSQIAFSAHWRPDNENPALEKLIGLLAELYPSLSDR
ncbi:LysR family transcriptional regulator [Bradyrhizobium sp. 62]|uniref:LysR family transcriptional regulator n=1 Tax=Bradyrhizobium sp. 62 TaxID=1043588 RepID=UPI001FFB4244|nr:LysR family transcriptional regulator [Bradyrhizobium sp. 62]MCK1364303.1 LysR family transcriptional regulator [Bradyrhizobium sp. 62]